MRPDGFDPTPADHHPTNIIHHPISFDHYIIPIPTTSDPLCNKLVLSGEARTPLARTPCNVGLHFYSKGGDKHSHAVVAGSFAYEIKAPTYVPSRPAEIAKGITHADMGSTTTPFTVRAEKQPWKRLLTFDHQR